MGASGDFGMTPLHWAAYRGTAEIISVILEAGADVNGRLKKGRGNAEAMNPKGATPFFMAAETCDLPLIQ